MKLKPLMGYSGSKYRIAKHYDPPKFQRVVEPFAGSAGYALHYADREVILVERNPIIAAVWRYLIAATPDEILKLPTLRADERVSALPVSQEARWLIGMNINSGSDRPYDKLSRHAVVYRPPWPHTECGPECMHHDPNYKYGNASHGVYENFWGPKRRARIARQVNAIKHWKIIEGDYSDAPDVRATWYIDPPYVEAGAKLYKYSQLDRAVLADWCRAREGQVMVCEGAGATWLPFVPLGTFKSTPGKKRAGKTAEVVWKHETKRRKRSEVGR